MLNITIIEIASNIISKIKCEEIYFNRDKDYNEVISFLTWDLDEGVYKENKFFAMNIQLMHIQIIDK